MKKQNWILVVGIVILASGAVLAADVDEGQWINLYDGETLYGWTVFGDGDWAVDEGLIKLSEGTNGFIATTSEFTDFELRATLRVTGGGTAGIAFRTPLSGYTQEKGGAVVYLDAGDKDVAFSEVVIRALGSDISVMVNEHPVEVSASNAKGHITFQMHKYHSNRRGPKIEIKEVKLKPLVMHSLFNGENLDGWNIIPDHDSVFSVVDNALNIKNGNGQIETADTFRNFVLQLDCISNGEHLNSGVFFRGPVGVFWKGYEAQIRNQWARDDRTRPVDFGTGGIYGVNPARKVVSTDHKWFTMTVVCCDNHMAAWVDGYQVSDFVDTRPILDNNDGKNGFATKAGTIHLQGHDPTTDLSFKNINLQEYPAE